MFLCLNYSWFLILFCSSSVPVVASNTHVVYELVPQGSDILVTDENKEEYLQLRLRHRMLDSIKSQLEYLLIGELLCWFVVIFRVKSIFCCWWRSEFLVCFKQPRTKCSLFTYFYKQLSPGLYEVIPLDLLSVFDYQELDLLLCGVPEIDMMDWVRHTEYLGEWSCLFKDCAKLAVGRAENVTSFCCNSMN